MLTVDVITVLIIVVGLVQLPILTDLLIFLFPRSALPRIASRATKPLFVVLFLCCCGLALHLFFNVFLPVFLHSQAELTPSAASLCAIAAFLTALALYIVASLLFYYCQAAFAPPSPSPPRAVSTLSSLSASASSSVCRRCGCVKTRRVHHCRICDRCVSTFDHHCPFTANCVGESTTRPYFLWLCFCCLGLLYGCSLSLPAFTHCILRRQQLPMHSSLNLTASSGMLAALSAPQPLVVWSLAYCRSLSNASWTFFLVAFGLVPVAALLGFQCWLLQTDRTTIECIAAFGSKPADKQRDEEQGAGQRAEAAEQAASSSARAAAASRKDWSLVHRGEPLYRLLAPDPVWSCISRVTSKTDQP